MSKPSRKKDSFPSPKEAPEKPPKGRELSTKTKKENE